MNDIDLYYNLDFLKSGLNASHPLTEKEELAVISIMRDETKSRQIRMLARNKLIQSHLRMIYSVAVMKGKKNGQGIPDLFQAGVIGMIRAACDYDPDKMINGKKCKFISYAIWWITQKMNEENYRSNDAVHVPMYGKSVMMKKFRENNIDTDDLRTADFLRATAPVLSIDTIFRLKGSSMEEGSLTLGDTIADPESAVDIQKILNVEEDVKLGEMLRSCVTENDMQLIRETYFHGMTQEDMGLIRNLSSERMRQKRTRALLKATTALRKIMKEKNFEYMNTKDECSMDAIFNPQKYK